LKNNTFGLIIVPKGLNRKVISSKHTTATAGFAILATGSERQK